MQEILKNLSADFFKYIEPARIQDMVQKGWFRKEVVESKWLGYPPATEQEVLAKEKTLGTVLPPSYKEFLLTSNGFGFVSPVLDNLFPIQKVDWAKTSEKNWFKILDQFNFEVPDEQYFDYSDEQDSIYFRQEYFKHSLKISEWYDGMCIFLNPIVKHGEEWEVLQYATWYPGTHRSRSFSEFLLKEHQCNIELINKEAKPFSGSSS